MIQTESADGTTDGESEYESELESIGGRGEDDFGRGRSRSMSEVDPAPVTDLRARLYRHLNILSSKGWLDPDETFQARRMLGSSSFVQLAASMGDDLEAVQEIISRGKSRRNKVRRGDGGRARSRSHSRYWNSARDDGDSSPVSGSEAETPTVEAEEAQPSLDGATGVDLPEQEGPVLSYKLFDRYVIRSSIGADLRFQIALTEAHEAMPFASPVWLQNWLTPLPPTRLRLLKQELTDGAMKILMEPNAGGSSVNSEALSMEILAACFRAELRLTENEVEYDNSDASIVDYVASIGPMRCGVSVTRAMHFLGGPDAFTERDAAMLLAKKLVGLRLATEDVCDEHSWSVQLLHIWADGDHVADVIRSVLGRLPKPLWESAFVICTVCHYMNHIIFANSRDFALPEPDMEGALAHAATTLPRVPRGSAAATPELHQGATPASPARSDDASARQRRSVSVGRPFLRGRSAQDHGTISLQPYSSEVRWLPMIPQVSVETSVSRESAPSCRTDGNASHLSRSPPSSGMNWILSGDPPDANRQVSAATSALLSDPGDRAPDPSSPTAVPRGRPRSSSDVRFDGPSLNEERGRGVNGGGGCAIRRPRGGSCPPARPKPKDRRDSWSGKRWFLLALDRGWIDESFLTEFSDRPRPPRQASS